MPHPDPEILALRALGEPAGTAADEEHIVSCADCRAELAQLSGLVTTARHDGPIRLEQPPEQLWQRIAAAAGVPDSPAATRTDEDRPAAETRKVRPRRTVRRGWTRGRLAVAAAGIAVGAGAAAGIAVAVDSPAPAAPVIASIELRPLPQFPQWLGTSGTALMRASDAAQLLDVTLRAPQRQGFYEVWLLGRDGVSMISLGDLPASHAASFTIPAGTNLRFYSRIDVSLQPFNGSTAHSKTSVVRGTLPPGAAGGAGS